MAGISLQNVSKRYPDGTVAVDAFSLDIEDGEFVVLVGPSGCGKSTLLSMVAGLEDITDGTISIDDEVINDLAPRERNIAMVFQSYALYPHMTVRGNMAFPLELAGVDVDTIRQRVEETAAMLDLTAHLDRRPAHLSGGQRQRLSIARALVKQPPIYLFDDSFSALDFKTDAALRKALKEKTGHSTVLIVTQRVSTIRNAEQIIVLDEGRIVGKGTHQHLMETCEIYREIAQSQLGIEEFAS